jgi:hypothetical protein
MFAIRTKVVAFFLVDIRIDHRWDKNKIHLFMQKPLNMAEGNLNRKTGLGWQFAQTHLQDLHVCIRRKGDFASKMIEEGDPKGKIFEQERGFGKSDPVSGHRRIMDKVLHQIIPFLKEIRDGGCFLNIFLLGCVFLAYVAKVDAFSIDPNAVNMALVCAPAALKSRGFIRLVDPLLKSACL